MTRPPDEWNDGTGHHLNNGSVLLSPLLQGNRVLGGVEPSTSLTHVQALDIDLPGRRDLSAVLA